MKHTDSAREDRTAQERMWQRRRTKEPHNLGRLAAWAATVFSASELGITGPRHYGTALLAHGIERARAIRLCTRNNLPWDPTCRDSFQEALGTRMQKA